MPQVYTAEFLSENEVLEESYPDLRLRNGRARFLRQTGWTVKCGVTDFTDLARCKSYWLVATRLKE